MLAGVSRQPFDLPNAAFKIFADQVWEHFPEPNATVISFNATASRLDVDLLTRLQGGELKGAMAIIPCGSQAYRVSFECVKEKFGENAGIAERVLNSIKCENKPADLTPVAEEVPEEFKNFSLNATNRHYLLGIGFWTAVQQQEKIDLDFRYLLSWAEVAYVQRGLDDSENPVEYAVYDYYLDQAEKAGLKKYLATECLTIDRKNIRPAKGVPSDSFSSSAYREYFKKRAMELVERHEPDYLNLCVELNMLYAQDRNSTPFSDFATFFREAVAEVKRVSPGTKTFASYSLSS